MNLRRVAGVLALLPCAGCATVLPNTAAAIAPATFTDVAVGLTADVEMLLQLTLLFVGI